MEKMIKKFLIEQRDAYQKRGLIPTLDLLIEDLDDLEVADNWFEHKERCAGCAACDPADEQTRDEEI